MSSWSTSPTSIANTNSWSSFLKSIASFNGDLSTLTAPPFILSPTSLSEYSQYWGEHPDLILEPNFLKESDGADQSEKEAMALKRMVAVVKWFISTLKSQYCSRNESLGTEKKALNPFLGEVFVGKWEDDGSGKYGESILLSEQVSHHPPITGYSIINEKNNTLLQGYNGIKATMSATSINIKQYGHAILKFNDLDESYLITLPPLHIEGLITASPFVELEGKSYIQSSNGYVASFDYSGRGYFSGKKNTFKSRIYKDILSSRDKESALVTISGQWSDKCYAGKGLATPSKNDELFYDAKTSKPQHLLVKPIEQQHPLESRKAWLKVAEAINKADYELINVEKSKIENEQRDLRKKESQLDQKWKARWFDPVDYSETIHDDFSNLINLSQLSSHNCPSGSMKGSKYDEGDSIHWRVNLDKWNKEPEIKA